MTTPTPPSQDAPVTDAPLSPVQEGLWFLAEADPSSTVAYSVPWRRRFRGPFSPAAFHTALELVIARHESLRTTFVPAAAGLPRQHVAEPRPIALPVVDVAGERSAAVELLARNEDAGFDVATGPLVRGIVARVTEDEHLVGLAIHHLVVDGRSLDVLESELAAAYSALVAGEAPVLPPPPIRYRDFATAQREWAAGEAAAKQLAHWRSALRDIPPLELKLPAPAGGATSPATSQFDGGVVPLALPAEVIRAVRTLCRQERAAPFMVLLAAFAVLLLHHGRHPTTAIGLPVAGRRRPELSRVVGMFVTMLAIPVGPVAPGAVFRDVLRQVRDQVTTGYANQDIPFPRVVAELGGRRAAAGNPVFKAMFDFRDEHRAAATWADAECSPLPRDQTTTRFDLELLLGVESGVVTGKLVHALRVISPADAALLAEQYAELVTRLTAEPDGRVADVLAGLRGDSAAMLALSRGDALPHPPTTAPALLSAQVAATPDAVAVRADGVELTYRELHDGACRLARLLVERGIGPEDVVGVLLPRSAGYLTTMLAVLIAGAAYLPLDPEDPPLRLAELCADASAALVLAANAADDAAAVLAEVVPVLDVAADPTPAARLAELPGTPLGDDDRRAPLRPEHAAYVLFTSGSTGRAKGVVVPHAALCPRLLWTGDHLGLGPGDRVLHKTPYAFDVSVAEVLGALVCGATLVVAPPGAHREPSALVELIASEGVTTTHFVPSMLRIFLDEPGSGGAPRLRRVLCSGEALPTALAHAAITGLGVEVVNLYGPTEAAVEVTSAVCAAGEQVTIGRPMPGVSTYVLDERLAPVPTGVTGELYLAGPQLARGYAGAPAATAERFVADPFGPPGSRMYRTGDLVRWTAERTLEYLGRTDHQVKIGGVRVEPDEVAEVLAGHPAVARATVVGRQGADTVLVGYLVPADPAVDPTADVQAWVRERLPARMCPAAYVVLDALPLTGSGKVDRKALPPPVVSAGDAKPSTPTEHVVLSAFTEVLGGAVGVGSDFFVSGGTSLGAVRVVRRLRRVLHPGTAVRHVFDAPTARELASVIDALPRASRTGRGPEAE